MLFLSDICLLITIIDYHGLQPKYSILALRKNILILAWNPTGNQLYAQVEFSPHAPLALL